MKKKNDEKKREIVSISSVPTKEQAIEKISKVDEDYDSYISLR